MKMQLGARASSQSQTIPYPIDVHCLVMLWMWFLAIDLLAVTHPTAQVLRGVSLKIYKGEAVGIIGASGTGKSTVVKIMAGLLLPDVGEVWRSSAWSAFCLHYDWVLVEMRWGTGDKGWHARLFRRVLAGFLGLGLEVARVILWFNPFGWSSNKRSKLLVC